ncbi:hypothetical protein [Propionimicrobium sp. PCR01-08-3]|uniref:hypothetical protein n=1 Tax=Propionimicrobium sp. PCR01-08-3 TaxID=3052086 RepID=UPI00255CB916|nr:hypothetical protein [Propionimicrobium sp. PCR01-08-3]WIY81706.1 hypothetical protein QQ658_09230 [Propionimicrobium sp. PCR01-08-3]
MASTAKSPVQRPTRPSPSGFFAGELRTCVSRGLNTLMSVQAESSEVEERWLESAEQLG